eukprot:CAMPEP_0176483272 /NCGR_PEP_ID=MMETSP0200_2-20121128/3830_1 /TAXON_ID=947934 /ORGANISM="Chaetoceros sp., Strain GSL56" /LENGTH=335 /DNA_ID=CAMNT_0017879663 /DNA_START=153 /DNA_END=1160 /DNA_ORIENTATION=+
MKSCIFVLLVFSLSLCSSFGAVPTSLKQLDSGRKRLLDDRRGGLDDIPERNVDDDLVSAGDDAVDDGQGTDDTPGTDDTSDEEDIPATDDTPTNPCTENTDGSFGNTSTTAIQVIYNFEMVTVSNTDVESTLSALEDDISSAVAGSGIVSCMRRRKLRRKLAVTGLSSSPQDKVLDEECSLVEDVGTGNCNVIEGRLTVYVDGNSDQVTSDVKSVIKNGMEDGHFASSSDDIIQLVYFEADDAIQPDDSIQPPPDNNLESKTKGGVGATPFIASGACALALIGFITGQRMLMKNKQNDETEENEEPENEEPEVTDKTVENLEEDAERTSCLPSCF